MRQVPLVRSRRCQRELRIFDSSMRKLSHGTRSLQRVEKALLAREICAFTAFGCEAWERRYQRRSDAPDCVATLQFQCFMAGMKRLLILQLFGALVVAMAHATTNFDLAAKATNELAVDLHRQARHR